MSDASIEAICEVIKVIGLLAVVAYAIYVNKD